MPCNDQAQGKKKSTDASSICVIPCKLFCRKDFLFMSPYSKPPCWLNHTSHEGGTVMSATVQMKQDVLFFQIGSSITPSLHAKQNQTPQWQFDNLHICCRQFVPHLGLLINPKVVSFLLLPSWTKKERMKPRWRNHLRTRGYGVWDATYPYKQCCPQSSPPRTLQNTSYLSTKDSNNSHIKWPSCHIVANTQSQLHPSYPPWTECCLKHLLVPIINPHMVRTGNASCTAEVPIPVPREPLSCIF